MTTTFATFGDANVGVGGLSAGIGGSAAPGDWLTATTSGIDGDGLEDVALSDDESGTSGWEKVADFTSSEGIGSFRTTTWRKLCVGGETTVAATWPGISNVSFVGAWASSPSQPDLYVLGQGLATWDGTHNVFTCSDAPKSDNESYIGVLANGRTTLTEGDIVSPPGETDGLFEPLNGFVHTLLYFNDDEAANSVADVLAFQSQPEADCYIVFLALGPALVEITGEGDLLLGGDATIEATGGTIEVTGDGDLLVGGSVEIDTTGGDAFLTGTGRFVGGRVLLRAASPFPTPTRPVENSLGCGIYQAYAFTRGLREIVTILPFTNLEWERILDDTSTAQVTIDGVANPRAFARCCAALSELDGSEHELAIYRNGWRVWSGPLTDLSFPAEQCVLQASDLSWWLAQRTIHQNLNTPAWDLANILVAYVQDAMSVENSAGLYATVLALAGQIGDRLVAESDHQLASDVIGELSRSGIDWTTLDRRMLVGPLQPQPPPFPGATPYPTLIDSNFRIQPTILVSSSQQADCWYVNGPADGAGDLIFGEYGPHFPATDDHVEVPAAPDYAEIEAKYGRIEKVATETRILDQPGIDFNAQTRYDLLKRAVTSISDGSLLPSTPIPMDKLLAGSIVNVHLSNVCRIIAEPYRIKAVKVAAASDGSETVDVQWQPLGTGQTL